ncbi:hypothetical protein [Salinibacter ruber]|uniref:hypothetical protein n=1 Tax=Salinibacter ruber TaxID=146919 RepID=UPI002169E1CD|nr:hypothetical protein [Salinibacter ruber]MCS3757487.1 hypothetical protein [Salinibacter ruber]
MSSGPQKLEDVAKKLAKRKWGFAPSREVKLIHFVNGFFNALTGQSGSTDLLHQAAAKFKEGKSGTTNEQFIEDARDHLDFSNRGEDPEAVKDIRMALDLMLNQDGAVYPSKTFTSFTASHWLHSRSDPSDQQTGHFMAQVLSVGPEGSEIVEDLRKLLNQPDDLYRLTVPLLDDVDIGSPPTTPENDSLVHQLTQPNCPLHHIQKAAERIVKHARKMEKTAALLRISTMGSFGVYLHLVNATENALNEKIRAPLLLCSKPPSRPMREASRRTFTKARQRLTFAFEEELADEMSRRGDDNLSVSEYTSLMRGWLIQADQDDEEREKAEEIMNQFKQSFTAEREGTEKTLHAFVRAATPTCFEAMGSPASCAIRLSTHGGLLGPFRGPGEKYYRPAPQFLDMLVAALLEPGQEIPASEFWQKAWETFGILSGARSRHDTERLREWGIRQVSTDALTENANALHDHLNRLGHANTYADGMTLISVNQ